MGVSDYTDVVARFEDELGAEVFARFLACEGISCHVSGIAQTVHFERYGVHVHSNRIDELRRRLRLQPLASPTTPLAAQSIARRLAREGIPCWVAGDHSYLLEDEPADPPENPEPTHLVAVPESFLWLAMGILDIATPPGSRLTAQSPGTLAD